MEKNIENPKDPTIEEQLFDSFSGEILEWRERKEKAAELLGEKKTRFIGEVNARWRLPGRTG